MSEQKFKPGDVVYRVSDVVFRDNGPDVVVQIGVVSPCGKWIECDELGYAMSTCNLWHRRRRDAEVTVEAAIRRYAGRCVDVARKLRERAAT